MPFLRPLLPDVPAATSAEVCSQKEGQNDSANLLFLPQLKQLKLAGTCAPTSRSVPLYQDIEVTLRHHLAFGKN